MVRKSAHFCDSMVKTEKEAAKMNLPLGKRRCKILKDIRQKIAEENDIAFVTSECKHKGDCAGTCPKCEAELRYLEKELEARRKLGKVVTVAGLAVTVALTAPGCKDTTTAGEPMAEYSSISSISSGEIIDEPLAGEPPMEYDYPSEAGAPTMEEEVLACSDELLPEQIMRFYDYLESMDFLILPESEQKHTVIQDDENGKLTESILTILDGRVIRVVHKPLDGLEKITEVTVLHND